MITWENYEEYMMLLADGEINPAETEELKAFIKGNKELELELAYYEAARLVPDAREVYVAKEKLLKKTAAPRIIGLQTRWALGLAAAVLLLIFSGIIKWRGQDNNTVVAIRDSVQIKTPPAQVSADTVINSTKAVVMTASVVKQNNRIVSKTLVHQLLPVKKSAVKNEEVIVKTESNLPKTQAVNDTTTSAVKPVTQDEVAVKSPLAPVLQLTEIIPEDSISSVVKPKKPFLARLGKQNRGLTEMGIALADKMKKIKQIRDKLKDTDVVIKVGNKELLAFNL